ncbi:MAG: hypothetical protein M1829_001798 [Trizodia sp. TS-e1964]|nr:MAG: hypothetical protein M1829_001798 [Trizodia sp. TS-e1964]
MTESSDLVDSFFPSLKRKGAVPVGIEPPIDGRELTSDMTLIEEFGAIIKMRNGNLLESLDNKKYIQVFLHLMSYSRIYGGLLDVKGLQMLFRGPVTILAKILLHVATWSNSNFQYPTNHSPNLPQFSWDAAIQKQLHNSSLEETQTFIRKILDTIIDHHQDIPYEMELSLKGVLTPEYTNKLKSPGWARILKICQEHPKFSFDEEIKDKLPLLSTSVSSNESNENDDLCLLGAGPPASPPKSRAVSETDSIKPEAAESPPGEYAHAAKRSFDVSFPADNPLLDVAENGREVREKLMIYFETLSKGLLDDSLSAGEVSGL